MIQIRSHDGQHLGWAANVLDLAEPEIRMDTMAPGLARVLGPKMPIRIGHTVGNVRNSDVIYSNGEIIPASGGAAFIDADCDRCDSALAVCPNQEPGVLWLVIEHDPGCPAVAAWIEQNKG
jgi:hypothetical protein